MMKLIDKDSVKKGIEELKQSPWYNEHNLDHFPIRKEAVEVVEHLCIDKEPIIVEFDGEINEVIVRGEKYYKPTIDVVPVVRCKDCKFYWKNMKDNIDEPVPACLASPKIDAFCSEGERRT